MATNARRRLLGVFMFLGACGGGSGKPADAGFPLGGSGGAGGTIGDAGALADGLVADGKSPVPPLVVPAYMGRIVMSPSAVLFTKAGERSTLKAESFDAAGKKLDGAVTWESSRPTEVAVDATGQVTSMVALGSAQIRARSGNLLSPPVLVLVAEPAPGAVLVSDGQVIAGPGPVDPMLAAPTLGAQVKLTVATTADLKPGTILLASEGKAVGGKVLTAVPGAVAGQLDVVLDTVPLLALFKRLNVDASYAVDGAALAEALADPPKPTMAGGATPPRVPPLEVAPIRRGQIARTMFRLGPLECEAKLTGGALTGDVSLKVLPDMTVTSRFVRDTDDNWTEVMLKVAGKLTVQVTGMINFSPNLVGVVSCEKKVAKIPFPIGGPLSAVVGFHIPLGIKGEFTGALQAMGLGAGIELNGTSNITAGFHYTAQGGTKDLGDYDNKFELEPKFMYPESDTPFYIVAGVAVGGTAGLNLGSPALSLLGAGSLSLLEAALMMKAEAKLGSTQGQFASPEFASEYDLKPVLEAGPGEDTKKALEWFGGAITLKSMVTVEGQVLAQSPRGTFKAEKLKVKPGEPVRFDVNLDAESVRFLGVDNVTEVRIYQQAPGEPMPKLVQTLGASGTSSWTWNPSITDVGTHLFYAAVLSKLSFGLPLELNKHTKQEVRVGQSARWRGTATCTQMGGGTVVDSPSSQTTYSLMDTVTIQAEHETDFDALGSGSMKITSISASHKYSAINTSSGGSVRCPTMFKSDFGESAELSIVPPSGLATLTVKEDTGDYVLLSFFGQVPGMAHHINVTTSTGNPMECPNLNKTENIPRTFEGTWGCGTMMGKFEIGSDTITGGFTTPLMKKWPATAEGKWTFQRL